jgi:von Willebrand factor type A domain
VILVIDATSSMGPYIEEAKTRAQEIVNAFADSELRKLNLTVQFMLVAYRDRGDEYETKVFVPLTSDVDVISRSLKGLSAGGGGDIPEMVVEAVTHALAESGADSAGQTRGALNRIFLIGDAPPHQTGEEELSRLGKDASSKYTQIFGLRCGEDKEAEKAFRLISENSGGSFRSVASANEMTKSIIEDLRKRAAGIPVEKGEAEGKSDLDEDAKRNIKRFLVQRGADISASTKHVVRGWIEVKPGTKGQLEVYVMKARWRLAREITEQLGMSSDLNAGKNKGSTIKTLAETFLNNNSDMASAGIKDADTKPRGEKLPDASDAARLGTQHIDPRKRENHRKIGKLVQYLSSASVAGDEGYVWVPRALLP